MPGGDGEPRPDGSARVGDAEQADGAMGEHEQRLRTIVESSTDAIMIKDLSGRYLLVNGAAADAIGRPKSEILGKTDEELFGESAGRELRARERRAIEEEATITYEETLPMPDGDRVFETTRSPYYGPDGDLAGTVGVCRDVTGRKARERELRRYETLVETSPDPMFALDGEFRISLVNRAMERLSGNDREDVLGKPAASALDRGNVAAGQFEAGMAAVRELLADDDADYRKLEVPMRTGEGERIDAEYHVGTVESDDPDGEGDRDAGGIVGVIRDVTEHREQREQIRSQRDQLEMLDRVNAVVHDAIRGVVEAATRDEIEAMVCERLTASEFYSFAWIGDAGAGGEEHRVRTVAGIDRRDLEAFGSHFEAAEGRTPLDVVLETGEIRVSQDVTTDPDVPESALDDVPPDSFRSGLLVPLVNGDAVYGVLGLAASRPDAFSDRALSAFELLGETVGFAIDATGNRRLLLGDAAVEVELRVEDPTPPFVALSAAAGCWCELERTAPSSEGGTLHYVTVGGASPATVAEHLRSDPAVTAVRSIREADDEAFLEVTATESVPARLLAVGATPVTFRAESGSGHATAEVPTDVDVQRVVASLRDEYDGLDVLAKRFVEREPGSRGEFAETVGGRLTARQRDALRAALSAGYYEWPRESTAEEVADSMDISSATLHYHLRRAESALVRTLLEYRE